MVIRIPLMKSLFHIASKTISYHLIAYFHLRLSAYTNLSVTYIQSKQRMFTFMQVPRFTAH